MAPKIQQIRTEAARELKKGAIGTTKMVVSKHRETMTIRTIPAIPANPSLFQKLRYKYHSKMRDLEINDRKYRAGELNFMFSINWIYMYFFLFVTINVMWCILRYREYRRKCRLQPEMDKRREEYDPFDSAAAQNPQNFATAEQMLSQIKSAADMRTDSTFEKVA
ncbi:hypothetical protein DIPPA_17521 [Diplonema papillatum]|nr:hypothetical protein DIPPA_17521 [Diplonema papillatum]